MRKTRLALEIPDRSRQSPRSSIDAPDVNSSTTEEGGTHVQINKRRTAIGVWIAVLVAVTGAGALSGVSITIGTIALWFVCVVPPVVMLMVWQARRRRSWQKSFTRSSGAIDPPEIQTHTNRRHRCLNETAIAPDFRRIANASYVVASAFAN